MDSLHLQGCVSIGLFLVYFVLSVNHSFHLDQQDIAEANEAKIEGNAFFKEGLYEEVLVKYETALLLVPKTSSNTEISSICHANRAACFYKLGKFEETTKECTKALELNPKYIKVLRRRGEPHEKLEHFDEAISGTFVEDEEVF